MALLIDDTLSDILVLASGRVLDRKFAFAQVSTHWRRVALNTPLLWTRLFVSSTRDCRQLSLALERSGCSAPLDIAIRGDFDAGEDNAEIEAAMETLVPYAARIRHLETFGYARGLIDCGLFFPVLQTLGIETAHLWRTHDREIFLYTRAVHVLDLIYVNSKEFDSLISNRLEQVRIKQCTGIGYSHLRTVLRNCPHITHLTFWSEEADDQEDWIWDIPPLRRLRTLDPFLPNRQLMEVVNNVVERNVALHTISILEDIWTVREAICATLLRGFGPIVEFEQMRVHDVELRNKHGLVRRLLINGYNHGEDWLELWPHLATTYSAQTTIRRMTLSIRCWDYLAYDLSRFPPAPEPPEGVSLRVILYPHDADDLLESALLGHHDVLQQLKIPRLARVEVGGRKWDGTFLPNAVLVFILQHIKRSSGGAVEVLVDKDIAHVGVHETQELLARECVDKWVLVS